MPKNSVIITIVAIVLIALGGAAAYITSKQGGEEVRPEQPVVTLPKLPEEPATTEPIDTSDWKTYRNEEFGFEIKYPASWRTQENESEGIFTVAITAPETAKDYYEGPLPGVHISWRENLQALYFSSKSGESLDNYLRRNTGPGNILSYSKTSFKGDPAYQVSEGGLGVYYRLIVQKDTGYYDLFIPVDRAIVSYEELPSTEKAIVLSFRFIEAQRR